MDADWIANRLKEAGKSQAALARAIGMDPTALSKIMSNKRQIKESEAQKIRQFFEAPEGHVDLNDTVNSNQPWARSQDRIPVMGAAQGGADGYVEWNGQVIDWVERPPAVAAAPGAYAVFVSGGSMSPRYEDGELVYVHPGRPVTRGSYCVVQFHAAHHATPRAYVKQYLRRTAKALVLHQFNPDKDIEIPADKVISVHRVVGSGEP